MDLFKPEIPEEQFHPNFKVLLAASCAPVRATIQSWANGFADRDNKFVKEFQSTFNSSFWELYLFQCLKEYQMEVDLSKSSPDFVAKTSDGITLNIEAVTANNAIGDDPEWGGDEGLKSNFGKARNEVLEYASVRLLNTINSKHEKYLKTYGKHEHVKEHPFVLAIAPFEQPVFARQNNQAINRVLYACDSPVFKSTGDGGLGFENVNLGSVQKENGALLDLGVFTTDKYKEISAVVFSTTATFSKALVQSSLDRECTVISRRYKCGDGWFGFLDQVSEKRSYLETHLDGLHIYYNPFAEIPLGRMVFNSPEVTHNSYNQQTKSIESNHNDGALISRRTYFEYE